MKVLILLLVSVSLFAETIGEVSTKGMVFKDKVEVVAFDDPTISGIACYTTVHHRALSFVDSSDASLACRQIGKITGDLKDLPDIFSRDKSFFFKTTVVDRFYDAKRKVLVYLSYTKDFGSKGNSSHSISVVPVGL